MTQYCVGVATADGPPTLGVGVTPEPCGVGVLPVGIPDIPHADNIGIEASKNAITPIRFAFTYVSPVCY
jgi:hypothetical protein